MAVISISRQFGSGGRYLAEKLAGRLGFSLADEELVNRVAEAAGVSDEWVRVTEREREKIPGKGMVSSLMSTRLIEKLMGYSPTRDDDPLYPYFEKIIPEMSRQDNIIFLGRGSQFILQNGPNVIKILLVAPEEYRIRFMMDHYSMDREEARTTVKEWEETRKAFLVRLSAKSQDDPSIYDLVFNTAMVNPDWVADLVSELVLAREKGKS